MTVERMTKLPRSMLPQLYAQLMREVKHRLAAIEVSLKAATDPSQQTFGYLHAEFAYLQVRRSIELTAVAVLLAHNELDDFRTSDFMKAWNAEQLFKRLEAISPDAFPEPFTMTRQDSAGDADILIGNAAVENRAKLASIYSACGDRLHAGSLKGLLRGPKQYDLGEIQEWRSFLVRLLNHHSVLLPGRTSSMTVFMASHPDGDVKCMLHQLEPGDIPLGTPHPAFPDKGNMEPKPDVD